MVAGVATGVAAGVAVGVVGADRLGADDGAAGEASADLASAEKADSWDAPAPSGRAGPGKRAATTASAAITTISAKPGPAIACHPRSVVPRRPAIPAMRRLSRAPALELTSGRSGPDTSEADAVARERPNGACPASRTRGAVRPRGRDRPVSTAANGMPDSASMASRRSLAAWKTGQVPWSAVRHKRRCLSCAIESSGRTARHRCARSGWPYLTPASGTSRYRHTSVAGKLDASSTAVGAARGTSSRASPPDGNTIRP